MPETSVDVASNVAQLDAAASVEANWDAASASRAALRTVIMTVDSGPPVPPAADGGAVLPASAKLPIAKLTLLSAAVADGLFSRKTWHAAGTVTVVWAGAELAVKAMRSR
ncbi:hypothetical protein GCM10012320_22390 [Sinomonas cellulolyticus]|nr:hypothetical protein GCM10012320_22390 [Sinomonas sp. KCTC 49339]